jgi:hypothetical protein
MGKTGKDKTRLYSVKQAAEKLGVHRAQAYAAIRFGSVPFVVPAPVSGRALRMLDEDGLKALSQALTHEGGKGE